MVTGNPFGTGGEAYVRARPTYPPVVVDALAGACERADRALDVGCGNGQLSELLTTRFAQVVGSDPSRSQLDQARRGSGLAFVRERAEFMGWASGSFDLIVAAQAAHWFDLDRFYAEARRVARPVVGVVALVTYGVPELAGGVGRAFAEFYWGPVHDHWPPERRLVEAGYRSLPFPFVEQAVPSVAIERVWDLDELWAYVQTWSAFSAARKAGDEADFVSAWSDVADAWGDRSQRRLIRWPIGGRLGRLG